MAAKRYMTIHFMDGTKVAYDFPQQVDDKTSIASRMAKLLEMQYIIIEADESVQFYPVNNIKSVQFYPVPDILPDTVIRGAVIVDI
jgi:hypothetical protein